jgi:serine/threonine protein kinase/tetratricopeptide (TPR) repeat protein
MAEIQSTLSPGEIVGHYLILGVAGAGGMGVVYKAFDRKLERTVALKFLPTSIISSTRDKDRFLKEARAASSLDHPNIGVIYGVEELSAGRSYIVMAFYDGKSLAYEIREGPIPCEKAIDIALQVAHGLDHAHRHKIVHRDIKPSNVMVTPEGVAKIVDFGLASLIRSEIETVSGETVGTIGYMSPEQSLGKPVDQRTDIWAWGIVLVEMLTGRNPYWRDGISATVNAILSGVPQGIEQIPALLQPIVYHALAKHPHDRYQSCAEILPELEFAKNQINSSTEVFDLLVPTRPIDSTNLKKYVAAATGAGTNHEYRKRILIGAASVLAVLLLSGLFFATSLRDRFQATDQPKHIAVLPFDNVGNDSANEALAAGLMDTMTGKLSNLDAGQQSLWVVPSSVVRSHKVSEPSAAVRDLGVTLVVMGSLQRAGQDVHLIVNLIDAKDLRQIGSASIEDHSGNLEILQDEAVARIAKLMNIRTTPEKLRGSAGEAPPAAYESYLMALGYMQRYDKPGNLDLAISALNNTIAVDPHFALGYAALGEAYRLKNQIDPNPKWIEQTSTNLDRAVHLNDRLAGPYDSLGRLHTGVGQYDLALQEFQKALDINSRDPDVLVGMAGVYERMSRVVDAEATYKKAIALRPDYWDSYNSLGGFYDRQARFTEALAQYKKVIELTPDNAAAYSNLGAEYMAIGDAASNRLAEEALKKSIQIAPSYAGYANLGSFYMGLDRYDEAEAMTRKALELNDMDYRVWCNLLLAERNRKNDAGASLAKARTMQLLEEHLREQPQDATALSWMAIFRSEEKQKEQAMRLAESAMTISPTDALVLQNVAEAYENLGDRSLALKYAEECLKNGNHLNDLQSRPALKNLLTDKNFHAGARN